MKAFVARIQSNLGCRTQFVLEGCSKTDLFENRIIRNNKKEINSFYTPKEYSETSVLEGLGVRTIRFSNNIWGRLTCVKEKPRFQCTHGVEKSHRRPLLGHFLSDKRVVTSFFFGDHYVCAAIFGNQ